MCGCVDVIVVDVIVAGIVAVMVITVIVVMIRRVRRNVLCHSHIVVVPGEFVTFR